MIDVLIPVFRIRFLNRATGRDVGYVVHCDRCGIPLNEDPIASHDVGVLDEVTARLLARRIAEHEAERHAGHPVATGPTDRGTGP